MKRLCFLFFFIPTIFMPSCSDIDEISTSIDNFANSFEEVGYEIDQSIKAINEGLDVFQALGDLDARIGEFMGNATYSADYIVESLSSELSVVLFCITDYIRVRAVQLLHSLKAELFGEEYLPDYKPILCNSSINVLDLNAPRATRNAIVLTGYDMDKVSSKRFTVSFMSDSKTYDLPAYCIQTQSPYEMTIKIDLADDRIEDYDYMSVYFDDQDMFSVSIIDRVPKELLEQEVIASPNAFTFNPSNRIRGDADFGGRVIVNVYLKIRMNANKVWAQLHVRMEEPKADHSTVDEYSSLHHLYRVDQDHEILSVRELDGKADTGWMHLASYIDTDHSPEEFSGDFGRLTVEGDSKGDDIGAKARVEMHFANLHVRIKELN